MVLVFVLVLTLLGRRIAARSLRHTE